MIDVEKLSSYQSLDKRLWETKHLRYLASARLKRKNVYSQYTTCILSVYVLCLSLGPQFKYFSSIPAERLNFVNIVLSVCIIIITLLESSNNYQLQSERLYNCAHEISGLLQRLKFIKDFPEQADKQLKQISDEYEAIQHRYGENQSHYDYHLFQAQNAGTYKIGPIQIVLYHVEYFVWSYSTYVSFIVAPIVVMYFVFY